MDIEKRKEELKYTICRVCGFHIDCEKPMCGDLKTIISQEQFMLSQLEVDKAELLEALKLLYNHTKNNKQICGINQSTKELIQKMEK